MLRLKLENLPSVKDGVDVPSYNPCIHARGIVHLGVGAFHRSHQAWYTDKVLAQLGGDWRITGVSLRSASVRDTLEAQDYLYTVVIKGNEETQYYVIGSIGTLLVAYENPQAVVDAIAHEATHVITLTITEKGYCLDNRDGKLDINHVDINHDLKNLSSPRTGIGYLVAGIKSRMQNSGDGLTVISCDNLTANGAKLESAVQAFATAISPRLATWIAEHVTFPSTMVDRIVPATTDADRAIVAANIGMEDRACVMTESFCQWIIEEKFSGPVPAWDRVGATFVNDVAPYEELKLRLLNASHSSIAYLGCLMGYPTVSDAVADPVLRSLIEHMMVNELCPTLNMLVPFDMQAYVRQLLERFANRNLPHKTRQIAMDGSQKIPQRIVPALLDQLNNNGPIDGLTLGIAAWIIYTRGTEEAGDFYTVEDPMADTFKRLCDKSAQDYAMAILDLDSIFPPALKQNKRAIKKILFWLNELETNGAKQAIANCLDAQCSD